MIQRGEHFGLALKPGEPIGVAGELERKDLDRDLALQPRVGRAVDLAHAARAERRHDLVRAEL